MLGFEWKCFDAQRLYFWPISQGQKMDHQAKTDKTFQTIHFLFKNSIKPKKSFKNKNSAKNSCTIC